MTAPSEISVHLATFPGQLRKGDIIKEPGRDPFVLTERPKYGTVTKNGRPCQVYFLTGRDTVTGHTVKLTKSARMGMDAVRSYPLEGRQAPVFRPADRPEPFDPADLY